MNNKQIRTIAIGVAALLAIAAGIWLFSGSPESPPEQKPDNASNTTEQAQSMQDIADKAAEQAVDLIQPAAPESSDSEANATDTEQEPSARTEAQSGGEVREAVAPAPPESKAQPTEDSVVRISFVDDLAAYLVSGYQPPRSRKNPTDRGRLVISYKQVNMHYGLDPSLFGNPGGPADRMRKAILQYMFRPGVLKALYDLYAEAFTDQMVEQAELAERSFPTDNGSFAMGPLNPAQQGELLSLYADKSSDAGKVFQALGQNIDLFVTVRNYLQAVRDVNKAYEHFWKRDLDDPSQVELAGREIKQAIVRRERLRSKVVRAIRNAHSLNRVSDEELLYLAQWGFRRSRNMEHPEETMGMLADLLTDLGQRLDEQAAKFQ